HSSLLSRQRRLRFPLFPYTTLFRSPRPYSQLSRLEFHRPVECQAIPRITCRTLHPSLGGRTSLPARRLVGQNIPSSFGRWPTGSVLWPSVVSIRFRPAYQSHHPLRAPEAPLLPVQRLVARQPWLP